MLPFSFYLVLLAVPFGYSDCSSDDSKLSFTLTMSKDGSVTSSVVSMMQVLSILLYDLFMYQKFSPFLFQHFSSS